jgi:phosphatidylserine decarboxylase
MTLDKGVASVKCMAPSAFDHTYAPEIVWELRHTLAHGAALTVIPDSTRKTSGRYEPDTHEESLSNAFVESNRMTCVIQDSHALFCVVKDVESEA